jgi:predicted DNA-binding protein with PD1-like motif
VLISDIVLLNGKKPVLHAHAVVGFSDGTTKAGHGGSVTKLRGIAHSLENVHPLT